VFSRLIQIYTNSYKGITPSVWILAIIQLINRTGSMVLPFMTVYMTSALGYSKTQAGIIMSVFGIGSLCGSFLGGRWSDKYGPFKVQFLSLTIGGLSYLVIPMLGNIYSLGIGVFFCGLINDSLRPAASSMTSHFATPETTTRSFSLMRMAINLGVAIGPAVAGLLAGVNYMWLFVGDGITCIAAGFVFYYYFRNKQPQIHKEVKVKGEKIKSPYSDSTFMVFILFCFLYAVAFFQIFTGLPLYYKDVYLKSEAAIGLLLGLNGLIVFVFEMITVSQLEKRYKPNSLIIIGCLMLSASFIILNLFHGAAILIIAMLLMSFSEIFAMPFMISRVVQTATPQTRGSYLAAYTVAWALAFIISPYGSTQIIEHYNYEVLWWVMGVFCILMAVGFNATNKQKTPAPIND
jgi:predicted MFS family arabinose efflux permease